MGNPYEKPYSVFARALVQLRRDLGMSQTALANAVGTSQSVIARAESGRHPFEIAFLARVAEATGTSIDVRFDTPSQA
jgi:transcriptional regulator with XRE-family HTH domain